VVKEFRQKGRIAILSHFVAANGFVRPKLTPSNSWFLGPTRGIPPNGISVGSAVFVGLSDATNRQTDKQTDRPTTQLRL